MTLLHSPSAPHETWHVICPASLLTPDRGVAALVAGRPIAVFLLSSGALHAVDNIDPFSGASVISRGLVGDHDGASTVASPMYKHRFDLSTGISLDQPDTALAVHTAQVRDGQIVVRVSTT